MASSNTIVQTNILAVNSHRNLGLVGTTKEKSSQKLSSGYKINSAADDAAGLAISEKMRAQIRGLDGASKNTQDGISLIQTAEGGLNTINKMIVRIRELVEDAANDTKEYSTEANTGTSDGRDRQKIQDEINELVKGINDIAQNTEFNKKKLLRGDYNNDKTVTGITVSYLDCITQYLDKVSSAAGQEDSVNTILYNNTAFTSGDPLWLQIGANALQGIQVFINDVSAYALGLADSGATITDGQIWINVMASSDTGSALSGDQVSKYLTGLDAALTYVTAQRSKLGAIQNRLDYTDQNLQVASENLQNAESRISNTDMAKEMMTLTKANIIQQAAISMLAQANQQPQSVLQLLQ